MAGKEREKRQTPEDEQKKPAGGDRTAKPAAKKRRGGGSPREKPPEAEKEKPKTAKATGKPASKPGKSRAGKPGESQEKPPQEKQPEKPAEESRDGIPWDRIHAEYIAGEMSCAALAEKHQISVNVLRKKATKEGWVEHRRKAREKVAKKLTTRAARAREEKALKGINLTKYIADVWTDNLKALNELIKATPEYMLSQPSFAAGIPRGLKETYELIMTMQGRGYMDRKLKNEEKKLKLEREKFELEKAKWEKELEQKKIAASTADEVWKIIEDDGEVSGIDV